MIKAWAWASDALGNAGLASPRANRNELLALALDDMLRHVDGPIDLCLPGPALADEIAGTTPTPLHLAALLERARTQIVNITICGEPAQAHGFLQRNPLILQARRSTVTIASDGSYHPHEHDGAWAWVRRGRTGAGYLAEADGSLSCEILAATEAILSVDAHQPIELLTDARAVAELVNYLASTGQIPTWLCVQLGTTARQIEPLAQAVRDRYIVARWVQGHADCKLQNRADVLARKTRRIGNSKTPRRNTRPEPARLLA